MKKTLFIFLVLILMPTGSFANEKQDANKTAIVKALSIFEDYDVSLVAAKGCLSKPFEDDKQMEKYLTNSQFVLMSTLQKIKEDNQKMPEQQIVDIVQTRRKEHQEIVEKAIKNKGCKNNEIQQLIKIHKTLTNMPSFNEWKKR